MTYSGLDGGKRINQRSTQIILHSSCIQVLPLHAENRLLAAIL